MHRPQAGCLSSRRPPCSTHGSSTPIALELMMTAASPRALKHSRAIKPALPSMPSMPTAAVQCARTAEAHAMGLRRCAAIPIVPTTPTAMTRLFGTALQCRYASSLCLLAHSRTPCLTPAHPRPASHPRSHILLTFLLKFLLAFLLTFLLASHLFFLLVFLLILLLTLLLTSLPSLHTPHFTPLTSLPSRTSPLPHPALPPLHRSSLLVSPTLPSRLSTGPAFSSLGAHRLFALLQARVRAEAGPHQQRVAHAARGGSDHARQRLPAGAVRCRAPVRA